ncbi:MAG: hypothetical protein K8S99_15725 [Planctomycetes bacterium]|nr:hypothetical protein [Planctomycetota bacterium]
MIPVFIGFTIANLGLMLAAFILGTFILDANDRATILYSYHMDMGIYIALLSAGTHVLVYTYFMASTKWLRAATDKANLDPAVYVDIPAARKRRVLPIAMLAMASTMTCVFAGAWVDRNLAEDWRRDPAGKTLGVVTPATLSDTTEWGRQLHLGTAVLAIAVNLGCAWAEYTLIRAQSQLMKTALDVFTRSTPT